MAQVVRIDKGRIKDHLREMVCGMVAEALKAMFDPEESLIQGNNRRRNA